MNDEEKIDGLSNAFQSTFSLVKKSNIKRTLLANMFHIDERQSVLNLIDRFYPNSDVQIIKTGQMGDDPYDIHMIQIDRGICDHR